MFRLPFQQGQQRCLGQVEQGHLAFGEGVMGAWLAIEQGDLAEPVGRFHQHQQQFLATFADAADAHRAFQHRIEPAGRVAAVEKPLPGRQPAQLGHGQEFVLQGGGQLAEPFAGEQEVAVVLQFDHGLCRLSDRGGPGHGAIIATIAP
ncbi:hypothetical protein D9M68_703170 [compost metagenome]